MSLRRPTCLTFKITPFKTRLVLSSYTKSALTCWTNCSNPLAIVGIMYIYILVSCQLTCQSSRCMQLPLYPQHSGTEWHSSSHLGRWCWYELPSFWLTLSDPHSHLQFLSTAHRLDLQHRWHAGCHHQNSIHWIGPIQCSITEAVYHQWHAVWHIQDCWQTIVPECVQSWPWSPHISAHHCSAGVHTDYESAAAEVYIVASKWRLGLLRFT